MRKEKGETLEANLVIESEDLGDLLGEARDYLLENGQRTESQRGLTWNLNNVLLVWKSPGLEKGRYNFWPRDSDEWYQDNFVSKEKTALPENLAEPGDLLFPYTYVQRARYRDDGWGYGLAVVAASRELGTSVPQVLGNFDSFQEWLGRISERVHLQTVLAVLSWWGRTQFGYWLRNEAILRSIVEGTRFDSLERITEEVAVSPTTRRAITPSFVYSLDYYLMMGMPPYQNFQLLPGSANEPLSSLHWHRSLDASGGAQLDFSHDFDWLSFAAEKIGREMGSITILAGNLHLYAASQDEAKSMVAGNDNIREWLLRVTDGYRTGEGHPLKLLQTDAYQEKVRKVYSLLGGK